MRCAGEEEEALRYLQEGAASNGCGAAEFATHAEQLRRLGGTHVTITWHGHMRMRRARWRVEHGDRMFRM